MNERRKLLNDLNSGQIVLTPGIYAHFNDGTFSSRTSYTEQEKQQIDGVAVVTMDNFFVVDKNLQSYYPGCSQITTFASNGFTIYGNQQQALLDFDGESNTENIVEEYGGTSSYYNQAPAATYCYNQTYMNGELHGYLPSVGELSILGANVIQFDEMMTAVGGTTQKNKSAVSSTIGGERGMFWVCAFYNRNTAFSTSSVQSNSRYPVRCFFKPKNITVVKTCPIGEAVDLGLPSGTKWASGCICKRYYNDYYIGASYIYRTFFSWGSTTGYNQWDYAYANPKPFTDDGYSDALEQRKQDVPSGDPAYDPARLHLGSPWRTPTRAECDELFSNCTVTNVSNYCATGCPGWVLRSTVDGYTDKEIFFPAFGEILPDGYFGEYTSSSNIWTTSYYGGGDEGWSGSIYGSYMPSVSGTGKSCGLSIHPVQ